MEFRKDSEVADWALSGAKSLNRPLKTWEREALRRKRRGLLQAAVEMEDLAMSGTASEAMAASRQKTARKYRDQIAKLEKVMSRFKILEGTTMKITKRQLQRIIKEEKQKLLNEGVPSALGMEILSIKDALFDIKMGVAYHDDELANDLELQIDRLLRLGYKA